MTAITPPAGPNAVLAGALRMYVAFDWGEEIDLVAAQRLVPAEPHALARRRRTPSSIVYRPPPLRVALPPLTLDLAELGPAPVFAEATLFDFAGVSVALQAPFQLPSDALLRLAASLAEPAGIVAAARNALSGLYETLRPTIRQPAWSDLSEEYFVFELPPTSDLTPQDLLASWAPWLAGVVRLEMELLSREEIAEALRLRLTYSPHDLMVAEWAAAVVIDRDCDETLQMIELANLQLLEFRFLDDRLDRQLLNAYTLVHPPAGALGTLLRRHTRPLRALGNLKIEAHELFDRASNVLKLVGDQYLARAYRLLTERFHLSSWEQNIRHSLDVAESVYQVVSDQATAYRAELLEVIIVLLILLEIALAVFGK